MGISVTQKAKTTLLTLPVLHCVTDLYFEEFLCRVPVTCCVEKICVTSHPEGVRAHFLSFSRAAITPQLVYCDIYVSLAVTEP
jgi:hypothetical protein